MTDRPTAARKSDQRFVTWVTAAVGGSVLIWFVLSLPSFVGGTAEPSPVAIAIAVVVAYPILIARRLSLDAAQKQAKPFPSQVGFAVVWLAATMGPGAIAYYSSGPIYWLCVDLALGPDPFAGTGSDKLIFDFSYFSLVGLLFPVFGYVGGAILARWLAGPLSYGLHAARAWRHTHRWGGVLMMSLLLIALWLAASLPPISWLQSVVGVLSVAVCTVPHCYLLWSKAREIPFSKSVDRVFE